LETSSAERNGAVVIGSLARVVLADDHAVVREGLRAVLEAEGGIEVVGEAADGREAVEACAALAPDVVLMDVRMPGMDGLEATRAIKAGMPKVSVVMVTMHENPDYLLEAVRAGAAGYVLKDSSGGKIAEAVRRTLAGDSPLEEGLAMRLLERLTGGEGDEAALELSGGLDAEAGSVPSQGVPEGITPREAEVLSLMARGLTNPQIARALLYSVSTVKASVRSVMAKLGVSDRTQAAVRAIELGMVTSGAGEQA
jgi:NarL family two-component system response regulator LiaR